MNCRKARLISIPFKSVKKQNILQGCLLLKAVVMETLQILEKLLLCAYKKLLIDFLTQRIIYYVF